MPEMLTLKLGGPELPRQFTQPRPLDSELQLLVEMELELCELVEIELRLWLLVDTELELADTELALGLLGLLGLDQDVLMDDVLTDEGEDDVPRLLEPRLDEPNEDDPKLEDPRLLEPRLDEPKEDEPKEDEPRLDEPNEDEPNEDEPNEDEPRLDGLLLLSISQQSGHGRNRQGAGIVATSHQQAANRTTFRPFTIPTRTSVWITIGSSPTPSRGGA